MPCFEVSTNVKEVPANFKQLATQVIAKSMNKPVEYIAIQVNAGKDISFGGSDEPAALCDLTSIGHMSVELNKKYSKDLMELIEQQLGVKSNRVYINFHDMPKSEIGYNKTTFDDLI